MSVKKNKSLMRRWFEMEDLKGVPKSQIETALRKAAKEMYRPDFVVHLSEGDLTLEAYLKVIIERLNAFPDYNNVIDDMVSEGDRVYARLTVHGTFRNTFRGIPANGKAYVLPGVAIGRIKDGKFAEGWGYYDNLSLMKQLGMPPSR